MTEVTLKEFKKNQKGVTGKRHHEVINSLGIRQAFLFVQKHKWFNIGKVLKEAQFQQIIRQVNNLLANELMNGREVTLPCRMGKIELRCIENSPVFKDGKLKVTYPIDWDSTLKLWYENPQALKDKTLVRFNSRVGYKFLYNKSTANYNNKSFFQFNVNRDIKTIVHQNIKQGNITGGYLV